MLPKQSAGLFRRIVTTRFYMLLVGENSCFPPHPFSAFEHFDCAPARRVAVLRTEYPHSVRRFRLTATRALPSTRKGDASPLTPD